MKNSAKNKVVVTQVEDCFQGEGVDFIFSFPLDNLLFESFIELGECKRYTIRDKAGYTIDCNSYKIMGIEKSNSFRVSFKEKIDKHVLKVFESKISDYLNQHLSIDGTEFQYNLF